MKIQKLTKQGTITLGYINVGKTGEMTADCDVGRRILKDSPNYSAEQLVQKYSSTDYVRLQFVS